MIKQVNNLIPRRRTDWRWLVGSFVFLLSSTAWAQTSGTVEQALNRCGVADHERILQQRNPDRLRQLNELNQRVQQLQTEVSSLRQAADGTTFRIPVVVHVVHSNATNTVGGAGNVNISDAQIISQIQVLNEDYRRKPGTNGYNTSAIGADANIEFYLATTDPNGQPSTGITRHYYPQKTTFDVFNDDVLLSQIAYWPSDRYLNIWVTRVSTYLGYTQFPTMADTLTGLTPAADSNEFTDGSIIDYRYFGKQTGTVTSATYALGRTATHEIGHWLGLLHPNGDVDCGDDHVTDTPPTDDLNQTTRCADLFSTCSGQRTRELIENYLMYSPDACMNMFTVGQVARMRAVLQVSPRRAKMIKLASAALGETETLTINVYPNPTTYAASIDVQLKGSQSFSVDLFDATGRQLRSSSFTNSPSTSIPVSVTGLTAGIYIVRVKTAGEVVSKRLLVR